MEGARDSGDLYQGSVSTPLEEKPKIIPFVSQTVSEEVPKTTLKEELPKAEDLLRKNELSTENEFAFAPKIEEPTILQDSGW